MIGGIENETQIEDSRFESVVTMQGFTCYGIQVDTIQMIQH